MLLEYCELTLWYLMIQILINKILTNAKIKMVPASFESATCFIQDKQLLRVPWVG